MRTLLMAAPRYRRADGRDRRGARLDGGVSLGASARPEQVRADPVAVGLSLSPERVEIDAVSGQLGLELLVVVEQPDHGVGEV
jgi:hypothetical protein